MCTPDPSLSLSGESGVCACAYLPPPFGGTLYPASVREVLRLDEKGEECTRYLSEQSEGTAWSGS